MESDELVVKFEVVPHDHCSSRTNFHVWHEVRVTACYPLRFVGYRVTEP